MGRLSGFEYRQAARRLMVFEDSFDRPGPGSRDVWRHQISGHEVTLPHQARDMAECTLRAILREAGIDVEELLTA